MKFIYLNKIFKLHCKSNRFFVLVNHLPHLGRNKNRYNHYQMLDQSSGPQDLLYLLYLKINCNKMIIIIISICANTYIFFYSYYFIIK